MILFDKFLNIYYNQIDLNYIGDSNEKFKEVFKSRILLYGFCYMQFYFSI